MPVKCVFVTGRDFKSKFNKLNRSNFSYCDLTSVTVAS